MQKYGNLSRQPKYTDLPPTPLNFFTVLFPGVGGGWRPLALGGVTWPDGYGDP